MSKTLYKENILDHYKNPRNFSSLEVFTNTASLSNVTCGDEMEVFLNVKGDIIEEISFQARGCAISIASMSMLSEKVLGKKVSYAKGITESEILSMLGMDKESPRTKCGLLSIQTLKKALH